MYKYSMFFFFFFSSRRRHTRLQGDWSSDVCSSDLVFIGWLGRDHQAAPDYEGAEDVRDRLNRIGDQCPGMAEDACSEFGACEYDIDPESHEGGAQTASEPVFEHAELWSGKQPGSRSMECGGKRSATAL